MFSHADRLPMAPTLPVEGVTPSAARPWGVSRMSPYPAVIEVPQFTATIDPVTQVGRYVDADGKVIELRHRKTNTGTQEKTQVSKGDGRTPKTYDEDTSQDSDQD